MSYLFHQDSFLWFIGLPVLQKNEETNGFLFRGEGHNSVHTYSKLVINFLNPLKSRNNSITLVI